MILTINFTNSNPAANMCSLHFLLFRKIAMTIDNITDLKATPLKELHLELEARMVPFAGYDMPVQYPEGRLR